MVDDENTGSGNGDAETGVYHGEGVGRRESIGGEGGGPATTPAGQQPGQPPQVYATGGTTGDAGYGDNDPASPDSDIPVGEEPTGHS